MKPVSVKRLLASALGASLLLQAGSASALGLLQAYEAALQNDPTYRSAIHENEAGQQYAALGRASLLPSVSLNYSASHNRADVTQPNIQGKQVTSHPQYQSNNGSLSLRQPLFNPDGVARYRQGVAQTNYSEATFSGRRQDLVLRLTGAYVDAQYAQDQLALAEAQRDAYAEQMRVNQRMFQKGEGTRTDMLETQAKLDVAEAQVIESRDNLSTARNTLAAMVGQEVTYLDPLASGFRVKPMQPTDFDAWKTLALEKNPELSAQRFAVEAAQQEVEKSRAAHAPRIDFIASYSQGKSETINTYNQDTTGRSIGLQMSLPLYSGGYASAASTQAVANRDKAQSDLDTKTGQVLVELRKQYSLVLSSMARIDALVKSVNSSEVLVEATRQSIKGGVRINLDLLNAQQQLYAARRDLAQARYNYLLSSLRLRNAAGTLGEEDLRDTARYFVAAR
ncbi:MAG TPA: TolC family outer membrane protein [Paucimonas sp.]|nr:TolC family outer membrane protein [Paucimonas sp.]